MGVTLGTGLGGGIILNRKIHTGLMGGAGELGCVPFHGGNRRRIYAVQLCLRTSTRPRVLNFTKKPRPATRKPWRYSTNWLQNIGELLRIVMYILAPEAFVIGGSVANSWDLLEKPLRKEVDRIPGAHDQQKSGPGAGPNWIMPDSMVQLHYASHKWIKKL